MSHVTRRRAFTVLITVLSIALVAAPAATSKKLSKVDKSQNAAIKKASASAASAGKNAKAAGKSAAAALAAVKVADATANGILGGIPAILSSLANLATGLQQDAAGLTQANGAIATLAANAAAQEYGVVKVQLGTTDVSGAILTSGDIPDDTNAATLSGTVLVPVPAGSTSVPVRLLAGVRSGESDGTGASDPVAWAGIVTMSVASAATGGIIVGGGNVGLATAPLTSAADTAAQSAPVYPIPLKAPLVDAAPNPLSFPTSLAIDLTDPSTLDDLTGAGVGPFTVTNVAGSTLPITVTFTVRFTDLTAATTADGTG